LSHNKRKENKMSIELIAFGLCVFAICMIGIIGCINTLETIDEQNKRAKFEFNERNRK
jgi:hypothetical protein